MQFTKSELIVLNAALCVLMDLLPEDNPDSKTATLLLKHFSTTPDVVADTREEVADFGCF